MLELLQRQSAAGREEQLECVTFLQQRAAADAHYVTPPSPLPSAYEDGLTTRGLEAATPRTRGCNRIYPGCEHHEAKAGKAAGGRAERLTQHADGVQGGCQHTGLKP